MFNYLHLFSVFDESFISINDNNNNNKILDFTNAFNAVRRDLILVTTADELPELDRYGHASLECSRTQTYGNEIISVESSQLGDPHSSLEYCDAAQPILLATSSSTMSGFVDDTNLEGRISQVSNDVQLIIDSHQHTGLRLA